MREKPFDLNGTWQATIGAGALYRVNIVQKDGTVTMAYAGAQPFFRASYIKNPTITGKGISRLSSPAHPEWVDESISIDDPDHIRVNVPERSFAMFRLSNPMAHDLDCDAQNSNHVARYYAWVRGRTANSAHDIKSTMCWLTIGANGGLAAAQSLLAAVIMQQPNTTSADDTAAFAWATKGAMQGDIAGQLELATFYREGKGTVRNLQKAEYWTQQAQQSKAAAEWKKWNADIGFGLSAMDVVKGVLVFSEAAEKAGQIGDNCNPSVFTSCRGAR